MNDEKSKKEKVLKKTGDRSKTTRLVMAGVIGVALVAGVVAAVLLLSVGNTQGGRYSSAGIRETEHEMYFDARLFEDGKARHFEHEFSAGTVNFFLVRATDGVIRAAYDACDVCYRTKRGYSQSGTLMVCNNCGQAFPTDRINIEKGGCNPAPLTRELKGNEVVIRFSEIEKGIRYF